MVPTASTRSAARILSQALASGTPAETAQALSALERQFQGAATSDKQNEALRAFVNDAKGRFKAQNPLRKIDGYGRSHNIGVRDKLCQRPLKRPNA